MLLCPLCCCRIFFPMPLNSNYLYILRSSIMVVFSSSLVAGYPIYSYYHESTWRKGGCRSGLLDVSPTLETRFGYNERMSESTLQFMFIVIKADNVYFDLDSLPPLAHTSEQNAPFFLFPPSPSRAHKQYILRHNMILDLPAFSTPFIFPLSTIETYYSQDGI
jgi:hypothetical protein